MKHSHEGTSEPVRNETRGISLRIPLRDIFSEYPESERILAGVGIDVSLDRRKSLAEVCRNHRLDPYTVAVMLPASCKTDRNTTRAVSAELMSLPKLCDHLLRVDHVLLRTELSRLEQALRETVDSTGLDEGSASTIWEKFLVVRDKLSAHLGNEADELFPLVRQMECDDSDRAAARDRLKALLPRMKHEHDELDEALAKLEASAAKPPPRAAENDPQQVPVDSLQRIGDLLNEQIYRENQILFRRLSDLIGYRTSTSEKKQMPNPSPVSPADAADEEPPEPSSPPCYLREFEER